MEQTHKNGALNKAVSCLMAAVLVLGLNPAASYADTLSSSDTGASAAATDVATDAQAAVADTQAISDVESDSAATSSAADGLGYSSAEEALADMQAALTATSELTLAADADATEGGDAGNTDASGDTKDANEVNLEVGTYDIIANTTIYGEDNEVLTGLQVYPTGRTFPPVSPCTTQNAKLVVSLDNEGNKTYTLTLPFDTSPSEIFTVQKIYGSDDLDLINYKYECPNGIGYGDFMGDPDKVKFSGRVTEVTVGLKNLSGAYCFGSETMEWPTLMYAEYHMPLHLIVDFDSATKAYNEPTEGDYVQRFQKTDEATGISVNIETTDKTFGEKLASASFAVSKSANDSDESKALTDSMNASYSTNPETWDLYSVNLKDTDGNIIASFGDNTKMTLTLPTDATRAADVWLVDDANQLSAMSDAEYSAAATDDEGKATGSATMSFTAVNEKVTLGRFAVVNGDSTYRWVKHAWTDNKTDLQLTYTLSRYVEANGSASDTDIDIAQYGMRNLEADNTTYAAVGGTLYTTSLGGAFGAEELMKWNWENKDENGRPHQESQLNMSVPASQNSKIYLLIDNGDTVSARYLPTTYDAETGRVSADVFVDDVTSLYDQAGVSSCLYNATNKSIAQLSSACAYFLVSDKDIATEPQKRYVPEYQSKTFDVPYFDYQSTFNGKEQAIIKGENVTYSENSVFSAMNAGKYTVTSTPNNGYVWLDGTSASKEYTWELGKAQVTVSPVYQKINQGDEYKVQYELNCWTVTGFDAEALMNDASTKMPSVNSTFDTNQAGFYRVTLNDDGEAANYTFRTSTGSLLVYPNKPTVPTGLVANGEEQIGVPESAAYTLSGTAKATEPGVYTAVATLSTSYSYQWTDGTKDAVEITWVLAPSGENQVAPPTAKPGRYCQEDGSEVQGVPDGDGYTLSGDYKASAAGWWTAIATLDEGKTWADGTTEPKEITWLLATSKNKTSSTSAARTLKKSPGTYQVTANLIIPAAGNQVLPGLTVYLPSPDFPPASKAENNATLVVAEDGTMTVTVDLLNQASDIFTLQEINSSDEVEVVSTKRGTSDNYPDGYGYWFGDGTIDHKDRILQVTSKLQNLSGYYTYGYASQYPCIIGSDYQMQIDLQVDFSSAKRVYLDADATQTTWTHQFTDEATGAVVNVSTTEQSVGSLLPGASLSVKKYAETDDEYTAVSKKIEAAYSDTPTFDLYDFALTDVNGDAIKPTGNTKIEVTWPTGSNTMVDAYYVNSKKNTLTYWSSDYYKKDKKDHVFTLTAVGKEDALSRIAVVDCGNTAFRWYSHNYTSDDGDIQVTLKQSAYHDYVYLNDYGTTAEAEFSNVFKSKAADTTSCALGTVYRFGWVHVLMPELTGMSVQRAYASGGGLVPQTNMEVSLPAEEGDALYFVYDTENGQQVYKLDASYADGRISAEVMEQLVDIWGYSSYSDTHSDHDWGSTLSNSVQDTPVLSNGYFVVGKDSDKIASVPEDPVHYGWASASKEYQGSDYVFTFDTEGKHVVMGGTTSATNAGIYTATATPEEGYTWADGTTDTKTIEWTIEKLYKDVTATYAGETINPGETPKLEITYSGMNEGESFNTEIGDVAPTITLPETLEPGTTYTLTPEGGSLTNYRGYKYVGGTLTVNPEKPVATTGLVYTGEEQTGVVAGKGYTLSGDVKATEAGTYKATATLEEGFTWPDGTTDPVEIEWTIAANKTALTDAITAATAAKDGIAVSADGSDVDPEAKWVTQAELDTFNAAIAAAQKVADNENATQLELDTAAKALTAATEVFTAAAKPGTKVDPEVGGITRLSGDGRYDTMGVVVNEEAKQGDLNTIYLTSGEKFPDALASAGLAGIDDGVIALTTPDTLSAQAEAAIKAAGEGVDVVIVGGTATVSADVQAQVEALVGAASVSRIAGDSRSDTAVALYKDAQDEWGTTAIIASGYNSADSLSVSSFAYAKNAPIFLAEEDGTLSEATRTAIEEGGFTDIIVVGGSRWISQDVVDSLGAKRVAGDNRYATSALIAELGVASGMSVEGMVIASGEEGKYPDALAGGSFTGRANAVMLLVSNDQANDTFAAAFIKANNVSASDVYILGGTGTITEETASYLESLCVKG